MHESAPDYATWTDLCSCFRGCAVPRWKLCQRLRVFRAVLNHAGYNRLLLIETATRINHRHFQLTTWLSITLAARLYVNIDAFETFSPWRSPALVSCFFPRCLETASKASVHIKISYRWLFPLLYQEQGQEMTISGQAPDLIGFSSYGQLKWEKDARPSAKQALRAKVAW
jgi:hypothetical protein